MKKALSMMLLTLAVAGCATSANYERILNSWIGDTADNLVAQWGAPNGAYSTSDGGKILTYDRQGNMQIVGAPVPTYDTSYTTGRIGNTPVYGTTTTYGYAPAPVYNIPQQCTTTFTVSPENIVINWQYRGNACRALPPDND